jgi:hypothetical protein
MPVKLFLDDVRQPPDDSWTWVKTVAGASASHRSHCRRHRAHGKGRRDRSKPGPGPRDRCRRSRAARGPHPCLLDGKQQYWPTHAITIHSPNVVGVDYMIGMIERYGPFERVGTQARDSSGAPIVTVVRQRDNDERQLASCCGVKHRDSYWLFGSSREATSYARVGSSCSEGAVPA